MTSRGIKNFLLWLPALFLAYVFARQGLAKFSPASGWAKAFAIWHFPVWFRVVVGCAEVIAAALLLVRRTAAIGATIVMIVMIGAMATHLYWHRPRAITNEILPTVLAGIVLAGRWRDCRIHE